MADWAPPDSDFQASGDGAWSPPAGDFHPVADAKPETAGRVAGITGRALGKGSADLASTVADFESNPIGTALNSAKPIAHAIRQAVGADPADVPAASPASSAPEVKTTPKMSDLIHPDKWADAVDYLADKAGFAKPETPGERVYSRTVEAVPSAALVPEAPIAAGVSSALGGGASQAVKEAGGSPLLQAGAGLAAGSLPVAGAAGASAARALVHGGEGGRQAMLDRLADAKSAGTTLSAGQAGGSSVAQYLEGAISKLWGGHPVNKLAEKQTQEIGGSVGRIVDNLSQGQAVSPMGAGSAIVKGIGDKKVPGTALGNMHAAEGAAYDKLDSLIPHDTKFDASGTLASAIQNGTQNGVVPVPAQLSKIRQNLQTKIDANSEPTGFEGVANAPAPAPKLSYGDLRALKTEIGNSVDWGFAPTDPTANAKLKTLYGAIKGDLKAGATNHSPEAAQAQSTADALYEKNSGIRESLTPIIDRAGGPEAVYQAATNGTKQGATKIGEVMGSIAPEHQNIVRATVLDKIGKPSGAQDAAFNANTFLTNWNKIDPSAKDALFGTDGTPGSLRGSLDSLTRTMGNISKGTKLRNPSGTAAGYAHGAGLAAAFEGIKNALAGHPAALASSIGAVSANNLLSRALTNPKTVDWLARTTKAPTSSLPNAVNQLKKSDDPDAQALSHLFFKSDRPVRASGGRVDVGSLADKLISRWKTAKRETDNSTKPLLGASDSAIAKALSIAQESI